MIKICTFFIQKITLFIVFGILTSAITGCGSITNQTTDLNNNNNLNKISSYQENILFTQNIDNSGIYIDAKTKTSDVTISFPSDPSKVVTIIKDADGNILKTEETGLISTIKTVTLTSSSKYNCANINYKFDESQTYTIKSNIYYYINNNLIVSTLTSQI